MRRRALLPLPALLLAGRTSPLRAQPRASGTVNVYNWSDYIEPAVLQRFTRETGVAVRYDVYDSMEALEGKLAAGRSGYDLVVPTAEPTFARLLRAGALQVLDRERIPNWSNLEIGLMERVKPADRDNRYGAIYLWGTIGLGINVDKVRRLAPNFVWDRMEMLFDPAVAAQLAPGGIQVLDSPADVIPSVLRFLGRPPDSTSAADLATVERTLLGIRPHVRAINSAGMIDALASGDVAVAITYSGEVIQAAARARAARRGVVLAYAPPKGGAQLWFDMLAVPADAPNPGAAFALINFLLQPDVMAAITTRVRYPSAVRGARALVGEAVRDDQNVYPPDDVLETSFTVGSLSAAAERARARVWSRFRAGA